MKQPARLLISMDLSPRNIGVVMLRGGSILPSKSISSMVSIELTPETLANGRACEMQL